MAKMSLTIPTQYLDKHYINIYLEDAISQLLEHKDENPKVNIGSFMTEYFQSVKACKHTLFRSFGFVNATPLNRASLILNLGSWLRKVATNGEQLSIAEYHSLIRLICYDFPLSLVKRSARIVLMDESIDCAMSFTDFIYAFQLQLMYDEFLDAVKDIFLSINNKNRRSSVNNVISVVVPTSQDDVYEPETSEKCKTLDDAVDSSRLLNDLVPLIEKVSHKSFCIARGPPLSVVENVLKSREKITYYEFLLALSKSDELNSYIGKLPSKSELPKFHISDAENSSLKTIVTKVETTPQKIEEVPKLEDNKSENSDDIDKQYENQTSKPLPISKLPNLKRRTNLKTVFSDTDSGDSEN